MLDIRAVFPQGTALQHLGQEFDYVKQIYGYRTAQELEDFLNLDENRIVDASVVSVINTMMEHLRYKDNLERSGK